MARYIKDGNGNLITTAGGTRTWICTQAEHDRRVAAGTAPNNCVVNIIDDYSEADKPKTLAIIAGDSITIRTNYSKIVDGIAYVSFYATVNTEISDNGHVFSLPDVIRIPAFVPCLINSTGCCVYSSGASVKFSAHGTIPTGSLRVCFAMPYYTEE